ncbi:nuclear transport factor 2 family protein [Caballeronia sp. J97]|uniref:nuclear transport factor 2 family protein n=1 Tax=Caballeronia sp. J97 TaxID=2805429 RepID=UPI002AB272B6|nr:nuclear transport factor 2 family protein [Caballeronia sp. J97]
MAHESERGQYLDDKEEIRQLLAIYCFSLDNYDIDSLGETFTEDGVMDQGPGRGGPIQGRAAIVAGVKQRQARFERTCHQLGQSMISIKGDLGEGVTYVTAIHKDWNGHVATAYLRYHDSFKKVDGQWRILRRSSQAMLVQGFEEAQWNWVVRIKPEGI